MKRSTGSITIEALRESFLTIDFPEYQRESTVWDLDQKQKLIDSIHRRFDISAIFMYQNDDGTLDCIDGRQRINAIMAYLGQNPASENNGFQTAISNEVVEEVPGPLARLDGLRFESISERAAADPEMERLRTAFLGYRVTLVTLSEAASPEEFNLQFLRLNLGALINAGEKLNAMVGEARDRLFKNLGTHPFLGRAKIPTRRFAREQIAAQTWYQGYNRRTRGAFARARHLDLQRFLKEQYELDEIAREVADELAATMDALELEGDAWSGLLRNRATSVSVLLLAWEKAIGRGGGATAPFVQFVDAFIAALRRKTDEIRNLDPKAGESQRYLIDFQRHVTQAAVEKPAVEQRNQILTEQYEQYLASGQLSP